MATVYANVEYVVGHIRYGHYELELDTDKEQEDFENMSRQEQIDYIEENGHFVLDDYDIDDMGKIDEIEIS